MLNYLNQRLLLKRFTAKLGYICIFKFKSTLKIYFLHRSPSKLIQSQDIFESKCRLGGKGCNETNMYEPLLRIPSKKNDVKNGHEYLAKT